MAAFGSLSFGAGVDYYTQGAGGRAGGTNYYTGAGGGEPAGRWSGKGAEALGLDGEVDAKVMQDLYERGVAPDGTLLQGRQAPGYKSVEDIMAEKLAEEPYATAERIREIEREVQRAARQSNTFADFTFSLSKDLTVQHTAAAYAEEQARQSGDQLGQEHWQSVRETIEEAGYAGSSAAVDYLNRNAGYTRAGRGGTANMRWVDAHDWTVATFFQHTSREGDPQLHYHNPILLATKDQSGKVRKLDTALIREHRAGAAAHGARVVQELVTEKLGWTFEARTDGNGHELDNVDEKVKDLFSTRTGTITERVKPLVEEYVEQTGHEPNALTLTRLKKTVSLSTRAKKPGKDGETRDESITRWDAKLRAEIGEGLGRQAARSGVLKPPPLAESFSPHAVLSRAVARVQETKSTFNRSDLTRAVEAELPSYLGVGPEGALAVIEGLVDRGLAECTQLTNLVEYRVPEDFRLEDGTSAYQKPGSTKYASQGHIRSESAIQRASVERGRAAVSRSAAESWVAEHEAMGMSTDQEAAIKGIMTSGAALTTLVGPAGAGKTFVLGGLSEAWTATTGGRVLGLATSEQATQVLRGEGVQAKNVAQWLGAQRRLAEHRGMAVDQEWAVQPGDIIVPDEASMADTDKLAEIKQFVDQAGARLLLTGDPKQLSAVGAGGAMDLVVNTEGADVYELAEVRRFQNTWEGEASLKLRQGDKAALDQYTMHDRIRPGGTEEQALAMAADLYVGDRLDGKSAVVVTPTNAQAAQVNSLVRDRLVEAGWVDREGVYLDRDGNFAGVGDIIKCRKVDWTPGQELRNQGRYVVKALNPDGSMTVTEEGSTAERRITAAYRQEFVELGYAGTVHSVQGMTCDTGIPVVTEGQPLESVYPAMTRGRERNTAIVVTEKQYDDPATGSAHQKEPIDAVGVFANVMETEHDDAKAALTLKAEAAEREGSLKTVTALYEETMRQFCRDRANVWLDELATDGAITVEERQRLASEKGSEQLGRLLRVVEQAGHDPKQVLREAATGSSLEGSRQLAPVLHTRISQRYKNELKLDADACTLPPADAPQEYQEHFEELQDIIRERRSDLGREQAEQPSAWALDTLGPVPEDIFERSAWEDRAGHIAAHREASGWTDEEKPLGPAPGMGKTEARAAWAQAWTAAGRPESTAEEHELSEGALRNRVRAMQREEQALPPNVYQEMQAVEKEIMQARHEAAQARNLADTIEDDWEAALAREKAAEHESYAERWEAKRTGLQEQDDARRLLRERTAVTRDLGERAYSELVRTRGAKVDDEDDRVTAEEWLKLDQQARVEDDQHRPIAENDLTENQLLENEKVDERRAGVIAVTDDGLPEAVPTDEDVAVGVLKTQLAYEKAADEQSLEGGYSGEPAQVELDFQEQKSREAEIEQTWAEAEVDA
jgi:conjugative relaxase-like TrwC/TraI family protein